MAITILWTDVASELGLDVPSPIPDPLPQNLRTVERLFDVASDLVTEYCRDSACPSNVENEAVVRCVGWLNNSAHRQGIKSQKVDDLEVEYFPSHRSEVAGLF